MTVCRMNQARSAFGQAVILKFFPEIHVISAGIKAQDGISYLPKVVSISRRWGIEISSGPSRSITSILEFELADLIICAEKWIAAELELLRPSGRLVSYESVVPDPSFMPIDPERLQGRYLETELAKVAWINVRAVGEFLKIKVNNQITVVIPETELDIEAAVDWVTQNQLVGNAVVIDANLRSPYARDFRKRGLKVGNFSDQNDGGDFQVFSSMVEQTEPERSLLSEEWHTFINSIGVGRPILILASPQRTEGGPLPDSYLAAIPAGKIEIIRSEGNR